MKKKKITAQPFSGHWWTKMKLAGSLGLNHSDEGGQSMWPRSSWQGHTLDLTHCSQEREDDFGGEQRLR